MSTHKLNLHELNIIKAAYYLDRIEVVEHWGRYTAKTVVPGYFIWSKPIEIEVDCPMIRWSVNGRTFTAVIPVTFFPDGKENHRATMNRLVKLVQQTAPTEWRR